jgi:hypothetical protein
MTVSATKTVAWCLFVRPVLFHAMIFADRFFSGAYNSLLPLAANDTFACNLL